MAGQEHLHENQVTFGVCYQRPRTLGVLERANYLAQLQGLKLVYHNDVLVHIDYTT